MSLSALHRIALSALALFVMTEAVRAQDYPTRPVKLVVPFIAGSPVDALARVVAQHVAPRLGQSLIIENQSGAGGTIGSKAVANAAPDGYTLLFALNAHTYGLYANPGYDPVKSFAPVATIAQWSHVLVVRPAFPAKSVQELIAHAKANPATVTFGFGINTPPQILGEALKIAAGADIRSIPYRGGAQAIADMLGDRIDMNFGATSTLLPLIREGKLRAIAFTGADRSPDLPEVSDHCRIRLPPAGIRSRRLDGNPGARRDAGGDRHAAQRGHQRKPRIAGAAGEPHEARLRAEEHIAAGIRRVPRCRDAQVAADRAGRGPQG